MPEFGFPAQSQLNRMSRIISGMRKEGDDTQFAAVTGRPADLAASRDGRVNEMMLIDKTIADLQAYSGVIALAEARAGVMQQSLDNIIDLGQVLADSADQLMSNGTADNLAIVSERGQSNLQGIVSSLNVRFAGRALFVGDDASGSAITDAASLMASSLPLLEAGAGPFAAYGALEAEFMTAGGLFDTTFYTGGAGAPPRAEVGQGEVVDYSVKADEDPVRRMLFNTVVVAAAFDQSNAISDDIRLGLLRLGTNGIRNAIDDTVNVQGRLGSSEARIATVKARNIAVEAALSVHFNEIAGADQYDAAFRLNEIEAQLQTALTTTGRLSRLSLANYL